MKHIDMNKVYVALLTLGLASCADNWDNFTPPETGPEEEPLAVAFSGHVMSSQMVQGTRADGSVVNLHEYSLPSTEKRAYWRYNATTGKVEKQEQAFYAGVFGCHTGPYKWQQLTQLAQLMQTGSTVEVPAVFSTLSDAKKKQVLADYYSANLFYNTKATIGTAQADRSNALSYEPLRFWPNQRLESAPTKYEYCTFWAYYPWNAAAASGEYGISITNSELGEGQGMGKVHFTMHPDAAQQNDFMISAPVTDCNRNAYPLISDGNGGQTPKPVPFTFYHALAQVRLYAFIRGTDKLVYKDETYTPKDVTDGVKYKDEWGVEQPVRAGQKKIDEDNSVRWYRTNYFDIRREKKRADIHYKMEFNNIKTEADFYPEYDAQGRATIGHTAATTLGSATVKHFIMNPYWFRFDDCDKKDLHRYMLNDDYMYGYFEDTPVYKRQNATSASGGLDGIDWSDSKWNGDGLYTYDESDTEKKSPTTTPLHYLDLTGDYWTREHELGVPGTEIPNASEKSKLFSKHYNYCPGNILMVVPQTLNDDDVPHIVLTATGNRAKWKDNKWVKGEEITAKVTLNLLKMEINWESGFIYCYAITDELRPGDDIVRGPESITVVVDTSKQTDQW